MQASPAIVRGLQRSGSGAGLVLYLNHRRFSPSEQRGETPGLRPRRARQSPETGLRSVRGIEQETQECWDLCGDRDLPGRGTIGCQDAKKGGDVLWEACALANNTRGAPRTLRRGKEDVNDRYDQIGRKSLNEGKRGYDLRGKKTNKTRSRKEA